MLRNLSLNTRNIIIAATTILLTISIGALFYVFGEISHEYQGEEQVFSVNNGEGFSSVNYRLSRAGIIENTRVFHYYTKLKGDLGKLKVGTYKIPTGANMSKLLTILTSGVGELIRVTIPEGKNLFEIGKILEEKKITTYKEFIEFSRDPKTLSALDIKAPSLEGYLFPETYLFAPNTPVNKIVRIFLKQFKAATKAIDLSSTSLSPHEVIILASIVEKETGAKWERPTIAGVYLNRLKKKMRLQADPTTIYGIWEKYDGNLRRSHLLAKTPYNTYKMSGLPLGPIANPSIAAIKAVLKPKSHNFLYFVSKNDGTHVFTPTYKEHKKAVEYWQLNRRRRKGKSWRDLKQ